MATQQEIVQNINFWQNSPTKERKDYYAGVIFSQTGLTPEQVVAANPVTFATQLITDTPTEFIETTQFNLGNGVVRVNAPQTQSIAPRTTETPQQDPCANATYRIGKIKELGTKNFAEYSSPDFVDINKQCILIGEIYKCCENGETKLGWVELGRSKSSKFYENCPDGGKRAVAEQYYDLSEIGPGSSLILDTLDKTFQNNTVSLSSKENLGWYNKKWSVGCNANLFSANAAQSDAGRQSFPTFDTFEEYFNYRFTNEVAFENDDVRTITNNQVIYNEFSTPSGVISRAVKAKCGEKGKCISQPPPPPPTGGDGGPPPPQDGPTFGEEEEIPGSRRVFDETEKVPVEGGSSGAPQQHPNKPCRLAVVSLIDEYQLGEYKVGIPVFATKAMNRPPLRYESERVIPTRTFKARLTQFIDAGRDPNCKYKEHIVEYEEDDPSDKCFGIIKKDVTRIYDDGLVEPYLKGAFVRYFRKQDADCSPETVKVYHPLDLGKDVMNAKIRAKTKGLFDGAQSLECHHTSSTQSTSSKLYYYEVTDCDSCGKTPYFALSYGHNQGSGSTWAEGELNDTPTRSVYGQYRSIALDLPDTEFTFYTNGQPTASKDIYIINFNRRGMSDRVDPGNWEIALAELRGGSYANNVFTGSNVAVSSSNKILTFIDDSGDRSDTVSCTHDPYVSYDVISGSLTYGVYATSSRHTYGVVYPNLGIIVLDPYKMNTELGFNTVTGSNVAGDNAFKLFTSISGSGATGSYMKARNLNYKTTNHYFVRVAAPFANYSNNPTYVSGSDGLFFHPCFDKNPQTYITSVGLYNDFNELLAVAKLSKPINKSFDNDVLIKIRLNW
jgi:hypothetical protein